jgi:hypothetical protein
MMAWAGLGAAEEILQASLTTASRGRKRMTSEWIEAVHKTRLAHISEASGGIGRARTYIIFGEEVEGAKDLVVVELKALCRL